jgi:hypothetical protein
MDAPATSPRHRGLFTPPEGSSLFIARFSDGATRIELEAPTALILARWVAKLGTRSGQAEVVSLLAHSYGVHLSDVSPQARTLAEAGLDGGPPPGGLHVHLARDPDVVLSVETALSLVALLRCFERVMGPLAAADVLEAVAETIND